MGEDKHGQDVQDIFLPSFLPFLPSQSHPPTHPHWPFKRMKPSSSFPCPAAVAPNRHQVPQVPTQIPEETRLTTGKKNQLPIFAVLLSPLLGAYNVCNILTCWSDSLLFHSFSLHSNCFARLPSRRRDERTRTKEGARMQKVFPYQTSL